jgi:DNA-binding helix-hairpin-helix protein with protein kinase domain
MLVRQEDTGEEIPLDGDPLGRGGEAAIYGVPGRPAVFAKVYHKPSGERAEKLAAMLAAPPNDPMAPTGHPSIAWPTVRLLAAGANLVVGYLMPRIEHGRLAIEFYNPRMRLQLCPLFHFRYLVRSAHNLAAAVRAVHERGYVVGDLNESNVLVTNQALVSLVDTDSFQVQTPGRLFRCHVGKPEYTPPELQNTRFTEVDRLPEHDAFGLAVLIFQFLMQGTHPFAGAQVGEGEAGSIPRRIAAGHWPYALSRVVPVQPSPHAPAWEILPPTVQALLRRAFEDGHEQPS